MHSKKIVAIALRSLEYQLTLLANCGPPSLERKPMAKSKRDKPKAETEPYRATEREKASLGKQLERPADEAASPRIKVSYDKDAPVIAPDHPNRIVAWRLLAKALGTTSADFLTVLLAQLA